MRKAARLTDRTHCAPADRGDDGGFTLLELMMALSVLAMACLTSFHAVNSSLRMSQLLNEEAIALRAAERMLAEIQATPIDDIQDAYAGHTFEVDMVEGSSSRLGIKVGGVAQPEGEVILILNESPSELDYGRDLDGDGSPDGVDLDGNGVASARASATVFPLDLNGDGDTTGDFSAGGTELRFIPVAVVVRWNAKARVEGRVQLLGLIGR